MTFTYTLLMQPPDIIITVMKCSPQSSVCNIIITISFHSITHHHHHSFIIPSSSTVKKNNLHQQSASTQQCHWVFPMGKKTKHQSNKYCTYVRIKNCVLDKIFLLFYYTIFYTNIVYLFLQKSSPLLCRSKAVPSIQIAPMKQQNM
jgi:hypothetical protein